MQDLLDHSLIICDTIAIARSGVRGIMYARTACCKIVSYSCIDCMQIKVHMPGQFLHFAEVKLVCRIHIKVDHSDLCVYCMTIPNDSLKVDDVITFDVLGFG